MCLRARACLPPFLLRSTALSHSMHHAQPRSASTCLFFFPPLPPQHVLLLITAITTCFVFYAARPSLRKCILCPYSTWILTCTCLPAFPFPAFLLRSTSFSYSATPVLGRTTKPLQLERYINRHFNRYGRGLIALFFFGDLVSIRTRQPNMVEVR